MVNMIKANLLRIFKNIFFIGGCVLAAAITALFTAFGEAIAAIHMENKSEFMILISAGTVAFMSVFTTIFINSEYSGNVIRNRIIAGHSQTEVFLSHTVSQIVANLVMIVCWFIGGVIGGAHIGERVLTYAVVMFFYNVAYTCFLSALAMRIRNKFAMVTGVILFYVMFNALLVGNFVVSFSTGIVQKVAQYIYNMSALGQWFANSSYGIRGDICLPMVANIVVSVCVCIASILLGNVGLNKRELK